MPPATAAGSRRCRRPAGRAGGRVLLGTGMQRRSQGRGRAGQPWPPGQGDARRVRVLGPRGAPVQGHAAPALAAAADHDGLVRPRGGASCLC